MSGNPPKMYSFHPMISTMCHKKKPQEHSVCSKPAYARRTD